MSHCSAEISFLCPHRSHILKSSGLNNSSLLRRKKQSRLLRSKNWSMPHMVFQVLRD